MAQRIAESDRPVIGAAPEGARDEACGVERGARDVHSIAPRYDLLNHVLSMNIDRLWWNRTARAFTGYWIGPTHRCSICAAAPAT